MKYVGFCLPVRNDEDVVGILMGQYTLRSWVQKQAHISSSPEWSKADIQGPYDRRSYLEDSDSYEWLGTLSMPEFRLYIDPFHPSRQ